MWPSQNIWTLNEALLGRESNLSFPNNLAVLFLENWFWVPIFFYLILQRISKWNFQILFIVSCCMHRGIYRRSDSTASFGVQIGRSNCCTAESYPFWGCDLQINFHAHVLLLSLTLHVSSDPPIKIATLVRISFSCVLLTLLNTTICLHATSEWVTLSYQLKLKRACSNNYFWTIFQSACKFSCNKWKIPPSLLYKSCSLIR